jgi:hypothetical protein
MGMIKNPFRKSTKIFSPPPKNIPIRPYHNEQDKCSIKGTFKKRKISITYPFLIEALRADAATLLDNSYLSIF